MLSPNTCWTMSCRWPCSAPLPRWPGGAELAGCLEAADPGTAGRTEGPPQTPQGQRDSALKKSSALTSVLEKASPSLAKPLQPKNEAELGKLKTKLAVAGFRSESAGSVFSGLQVRRPGRGAVPRRRHHHLAARRRSEIADLVGRSWRAAVLSARPVGGPSGHARRRQAIFLALPDALDLMVVCVEAGLGLDQAMREWPKR